MDAEPLGVPQRSALQGRFRVPLRTRLCVGVTGHRHDNPLFAARRIRIESTLSAILDLIDIEVAGEAKASGVELAPTRLHSLLADGADQMAAEAALARGWELIAPLPFGFTLSATIGAQPTSSTEAHALLFGGADQLHTVHAAARERVERVRQLASRARLFEMADRDEAIRALLQAKLADPQNHRLGQVFDAEISLRVALASRVMVEHSDFVIAVWDGTTRALVGGTGHTIHVALEAGATVVWIDVDAPENWHILSGPEALAEVDRMSQPVAEAERIALLKALVRMALRPAVSRGHGGLAGRGPPSGAEMLADEPWPTRSNPFWHFYRRVEALFGEHTWPRRLRSLRENYEAPDEIAAGSAARMLDAARALPGQDQHLVQAVETGILKRFAWVDGVSAHLSDTYRGGMTLSFVLGALAIVGGITYLPFKASESKWMFAIFELVVLAAILAFAVVGRRRRWHGRWFETRRVAEYLRHAPILLLLGVARPPGRWPVGTLTSWPEWYARHLLRELGLPRLVLSADYLRGALRGLLLQHVVRQRDYHIAKAQRLQAVHHNLDRLSERSFMLAIASVTIYLLLWGGGVLGLWPEEAAGSSASVFTYLGVLLPTFGGAVAGIRYFGDFERFSAISSVTAEKLDAIDARARLLLVAPDAELDYGRVADLAHAMDEVVVSEIESWQAVFGAKKVTVPV
jgi:hypothetical protein